MRHRRNQGPRRSTPPGGHVPVLLEEVLRTLDPPVGGIVVDCTVGWGGHSRELLKRIGPTGRLLGWDLDPDNLPHAQERLAEIGGQFQLYRGNFAGLTSVLAEQGIEAIDGLLADLGMSSMQVDDPERGFSYARDGPLDMRMDRTRGPTAADLLARLSRDELVQHLREIGDEPDAERVADVLISARQQEPFTRTKQVAQVLLEAQGQQQWHLRSGKEKWNLHPAARTFQVLRILVNRELANLDELLRVTPWLLKPGGRVAILSFHSGEDRRVKNAFRDGLRGGIYSQIAEEPLRARFQERQNNPRSRSAKLRWAQRATA